jgi:hypothetical protein
VNCDRSVVFPGAPVSSTNKPDRHNITEMLLKVALSVKQTLHTVSVAAKSLANSFHNCLFIIY